MSQPISSYTEIQSSLLKVAAWCRTLNNDIQERLMDMQSDDAKIRKLLDGSILTAEMMVEELKEKEMEIAKKL